MAKPPRHPQAVYHFDQTLELTEWLAESLPERRESYRRAGLLLLEHQATEERWHRRLEEYVSNPQFVAQLRGQPSVRRGFLLERHLEELERRAIRFGLEVPAEIDSDLMNADVALSGEERFPMPAETVYLPTVTPVMPEEVVAPGDAWSCEVQLGARGGRFAVAYTTTVLTQDDAGPQIDVAIIEGQEPEFEGDEVLASLQPSGRWQTRISPEDGAAVESEGECGMRVRLRYYSMQGEKMDVVVLASRNRFRLRRVPASFDAETLDTRRWRQSR